MRVEMPIVSGKLNIEVLHNDKVIDFEQVRVSEGVHWTAQRLHKRMRKDRVI